MLIKFLNPNKKNKTPNIPDMRFGRNVGRTFFEYYRFTNVLNIPMVTELKPRKGRPRTHRSRTRRRVKPDVKPRPRTTRTNAPISYTDLGMQYDSSTSNEGSPVRYGFGSRGNANIYMNIMPQDTKHDQFSLINIQASKFDNLEFTTNEFKQMYIPKRGTDGGANKQLMASTMAAVATAAAAAAAAAALAKDGTMASVLTAPTRLFNDVTTVNIAPKPYLSIIDFNQLTRGGLERATAKNSTTIAGQHK